MPAIIASYKRLYGESNVFPLEDGRVSIKGEHRATFELVNTTSNATGMFSRCIKCSILHS